MKEINDEKLQHWGFCTAMVLMILVIFMQYMKNKDRPDTPILPPETVEVRLPDGSTEVRDARLHRLYLLQQNSPRR